MQVGTAYDGPNMGKTLILIINQSLYFGDSLSVTLLNPNQMQENGLEVDDVPKHLARDPTKATHSIYIPKQNIRLPLSICGVISCLPVRKPSVTEIENSRWVILTSNREWDPHSEEFEANERQGNKNECTHNETERNIFVVRTTDVQGVQGDEIPASLLNIEELQSQVVGSVSVMNLQSSGHKSSTSQDELARLWKIGLTAAGNTLKATHNPTDSLACTTSIA